MFSRGRAIPSTEIDKTNSFHSFLHVKDTNVFVSHRRVRMKDCGHSVELRPQ